jgi:hypothetical protein
VEEAVPRTAVAGAVATVEALVPEDDGSAEAAMREKLALRYNTVRPFLALLGESDALGAAPAGRRLNRRDVFAAPSNRWADPRARLLAGARWEAMRADVLAGLSLTEDAGEHLAQLTRGLDAAWRQMADRLEDAGDDAKVEVVVPEGGGRARLSVDKLGAVGEPESLTWLKTTAEAMLPRIDLPDLLFEVHSWTGFLGSFGHVSDRRTRMEGLLVSLVALLVSQSCNIGLTPVIDPESKSLTRSRLSHVD